MAIDKRSIAAELRALTGNDGSKKVEGYAAVFNSDSYDLGGFKERISPTAFNRSLRSKPDVVALRDHDMSALLGRTTSGTLTLRTDSYGLWFSCKLPDTSQARDLAALIERGDVQKCSFGFICQDDDWDEVRGQLVRTVNDADLFDVSVVTSPAYSATFCGLRSLSQEVKNSLANRTHALMTLLRHAN